MDMSVKFYLVHEYAISEAQKYVPIIWVFFPCDDQGKISPYFVNVGENIDGFILSSRVGDLLEYEDDAPIGAKHLINHRYLKIKCGNFATFSEAYNAVAIKSNDIYQKLLAIATNYRDMIANISSSNQLLEFSIDD